MIHIDVIDTSSKAQIQRFTRLPLRLYKNTSQWVPPIRIDHEAQLDKQKHPFYEHSQGEFFIARSGGEDVGRIAVFENQTFNQYHDSRQAQFYFFESVEDPAVAEALFNRAFDWARARGLDTLIGPKGLGALDGYGMLVEGFEHRQMMTMMNYNPAYYPPMLEALGFQKEVDFVSCYVNTETFQLPERVVSIARRVEQRGILRVQRFKDKRHLLSWAGRIGEAYNKAFINNWEYYPLTEREIKFVVDNIMTVADPKLIKVIVHGEEVVGFLFGFPDISPAIQRSRGRLLPFGLVDMLLEMRRTRWISLNGAGILPEFQGRGGNALLYGEMVDTLTGYNFKHGEMTQVAETASTMRADLINLGGIPYKNHRVFCKSL
jgi:hypothetical protein